MSKELNAYIDSSVLLRVILDEKSSLKNINIYKNLYSSWLLRLECHRVLQRLLKNSQLSDSNYLKYIELLNKALKSINLVEITKAVLTKAEQSFPLHIGSLDAIHLSTAIILKDHEIESVVLTHDQQLAQNARALGFEVDGVGLL